MPGQWLLDENTARQMREARVLGMKPTEAQITAFAEQTRVDASADQQPRNFKLAGTTAEIRVEGVLTKSPDIFSFLFGGGNTTYRDIIASLAVAKSDPNVKSVVLQVDSPGGNVDGLFDTLAAIESFRGSKPLTVRASRALSAAYAISAVAGRIEAVNAAASFGSVGVAASFYVSESIVDITNTESPDKRPDVRTEEGRKVVQRELDAIHELFVDAIARGRESTSKDVIENFGRGATLLAGDAKKRGMIDSVAKPALRAVGGAAAAEGGDSVEAQGGTVKTMDIRTLKAQHADVYEQAVADGVRQERDRVCAHITLGKPIGAEGLQIAVAAIEAGEDLTMTTSARYMAAAMTSGERRTRQQESDAAGAAADGAAAAAPPSADSKQTNTTATKAPEESMGEKVVSILKARGGLGA
jgi:ClpP class serine protease